MKHPDDPIIGGTRKTLPTRKARKVQRVRKSDASAAPAKPERKKNAPDKDVEPELMRAFGEK